MSSQHFTRQSGNKNFISEKQKREKFHKLQRATAGDLCEDASQFYEHDANAVASKWIFQWIYLSYFVVKFYFHVHSEVRMKWKVLERHLKPDYETNYESLAEKP